MTTRDSHIGSNTNTLCPIKSQLIQLSADQSPEMGDGVASAPTSSRNVMYD
jgi:hypothetical protein